MKTYKRFLAMVLAIVMLGMAMPMPAMAAGDTETTTTTAKVVQVKSVKLNKSWHVLPKVGATVKLKTTIVPAKATNTAVTWTSSMPNVARVSKSGKVTAVGKGRCVITCATQDGSGKKAKCTVYVGPKVKRLKLKTSEETLCAGGDSVILGHDKNGGGGTALVFTPKNAANRIVTWKSSNKKIASVDAYGVVRGRKAGVAVITVTTQDGKHKAQCIVTVTKCNHKSNYLHGTGIFPDFDRPDWGLELSSMDE